MAEMKFTADIKDLKKAAEDIVRIFEDIQDAAEDAGSDISKAFNSVSPKNSLNGLKSQIDSLVQKVHELENVDVKLFNTKSVDSEIKSLSNKLNSLQNELKKYKTSASETTESAKKEIDEWAKGLAVYVKVLKETIQEQKKIGVNAFSENKKDYDNKFLTRAYGKDWSKEGKSLDVMYKELGQVSEFLTKIGVQANNFNSLMNMFSQLSKRGVTSAITTGLLTPESVNAKKADFSNPIQRLGEACKDINIASENFEKTIEKSLQRYEEKNNNRYSQYSLNRREESSVDRTQERISNNAEYIYNKKGIDEYGLGTITLANDIKKLKDISKDSGKELSLEDSTYLLKKIIQNGLYENVHNGRINSSTLVGAPSNSLNGIFSRIADTEKNLSFLKDYVQQLDTTNKNFEEVLKNIQSTNPILIPHNAKEPLINPEALSFTGKFSQVGLSNHTGLSFALRKQLANKSGEDVLSTDALSLSGDFAQSELSKKKGSLSVFKKQITDNLFEPLKNLFEYIQDGLKNIGDARKEAKRKASSSIDYYLKQYEVNKNSDQESLENSSFGLFEKRSKKLEEQGKEDGILYQEAFEEGREEVKNQNDGDSEKKQAEKEASRARRYGKREADLADKLGVSVERSRVSVNDFLGSEYHENKARIDAKLLENLLTLKGANNEPFNLETAKDIEQLIRTMYNNSEAGKQERADKRENYGRMSEAALINAMDRFMGSSKKDTWYSTISKGLVDDISKSGSSFRADVLDTASAFGNEVLSSFSRLNQFWANKIKSNSFDKLIQGTDEYKEYLEAYKAKNGGKTKGASMSGFINWDKDQAALARENGESWASRVSSARSKIINDPSALKKLGMAGMPFMMAVEGVNKLAVAVKQFGEESIKAYEKIQSLQTQLSVVYGSDAQSQFAFNEIEAFAKKSPFGVDVMTQQAILLKQSGEASSTLMDTMSRIGDMASGNAEKMRSISEVYARILSSTTVTARDLRQLANAGVPSYAALTKSFEMASEDEMSRRGLSTVRQGDLRGMLQGGKITAEDFKRMIKYLTDEGGTFYGAVERGSKTLLARKQNLEDAKEMGKAAAGEFITKFGGTSTENSFYGKMISLTEGIYSLMEDYYNHKNTVKDFETAQRTIELINTIDEYNPDLAKALREAGVFGEADYKSARQKLQSQGAELYMEAQSSSINDIILDEYKNEKDWRTLEILSPFLPFGIFTSVINQLINGKRKGSYLNFDRDERNIYFDALKSAAYDENGNRVLSGEKKREQRDATRGYYENYLIQERAIKFDEWLAGKTNETASVANLRSKSKQAYDAGAYGAMLLSDAQYYRNAEVKNRILKEMKSISVTDELGNTNIDTSLIGDIKAFNQMLTDLAEPLGKLDVSIANLFDSTHKLTETDTLDILRKNLLEVFTVFNHDGARGRFGIAMSDDIEGMKEILEKGNDVTEEEWSRFITLAEQFSKDVNGNMNLSESMKEYILTAFDSAFADKAFTTENAETINARQTSLWHEVMGNALGIDSKRIKNWGSVNSWDLYQNNFSQRKSFASIAKTLLESGTSLKDISKNMVRTGLGADGTQKFDWQKTMENIEEMAKKGSISSQQALLSAYQQQIDTLNELETTGISTIDSWEHLRTTADALGSAFSLDVEEFNDGTVRFKENTIRAAEDLRSALDKKMYQLNNQIIVNQKMQELQGQGASLALKNALLTGGLGYSGYISVNQLDDVSGLIQTLYDENRTKGWSGFTESLNSLTGADAEKAKSLFNMLVSDDKRVSTATTEETNVWTRVLEDESKEYKDLNDKLWEIYREELDVLNDIKKEYGVAGLTQAQIDEETYNKIIADYTAIKGSGTVGTNVKSRFEEYLKSIGVTSDGLKAFSYSGNNNEHLSAYGIKVLKGAVTKIDNLTNDIVQQTFALDNFSNFTKEQVNAANELILMTSSLDNSLGRVKDALDINNNLLYENARLTNLALANEALGNVMGRNSSSYNRYEYGTTDRHSPNYSYVQDMIYGLQESVGIIIPTVMQELFNTDAGFDIAKYLDELTNYQVDNFRKNDQVVENLAAAADGLTYWYTTNEKTGTSMLLSNNETLVSALRDAGYSDEEIEEFINRLKGLDPDKVDEARDELKKLQSSLDPEVFEQVVSALDRMVISSETIGRAWEQLGKDVVNTLTNSAFSAFNTTTKMIGENWYNILHNIKTSAEAEKDMQKALQGVGAELLGNVSASLQTAGLNIASSAALIGDWSMVAAGLGLAALGGLGNVFSGFLNAASQDNDKSDETVDRLSKLKDNLADLLSQARNDAEYYEVTLRNKSALTSNNNVSAKKVNDMVITPQGVFRTDPYDYIMAMKDPTSLRGSAGGVPNINFMVVDQSTGGVNIEQSTSVDADGTVTLMATISDYIEGKIANGDYNKAMATAQIKEKGNQVFA